jgi:D-alanine transaminase
MPRIAYVNGRYVRHAEAAVHIEDRGYQFADGVYEVVLLLGGRLVDRDGHLDRLDRSLAELRIEPPVPRRVLLHLIGEVVRRNHLTDGMVYLQVTRGVAPRDHPFPKNVRPALVITAKRFALHDPAMVAKGVGVITLPDIRWGRCDIKTVGLLPNVLAKQQAREAGAYEAWLVDRDGFVTEGSSTNAWIVTRSGVLVTRALGKEILPGITRHTVAGIARSLQLAVEERAFTVAEAQVAAEAFITSASSFVMPVVTIDGYKIGGGSPGPISVRLRENYLAGAGS